MSIAVVVITDGRRDCLERTLRSASHQVTGDICHTLLVDDSGDDDHADWTEVCYGQVFDRIHHGARSGFDGAIRTAWSLVPDDVDHVFHLEDDFTFNRPVDLDDLADVLDAHPNVAQMALRRQPVNQAEADAGGLIEMWPDEYADRRTGQHRWLEHRLFFTTNPSIYRRSLTDRRWPDAPRSEAKFTDELTADGFSFGYWGTRHDGPWVTHIGSERVGVGY